MEKIIKNATINTAEDIRTLASEISTKFTFTEIPEEFLTVVKNYNEKQVNTLAYKYATLATTQDFFNSFICVQCEKAYKAITADTLSAKLNESGNIEVMESTTPIAFNNVYAMRLEYEASKHTDKDKARDKANTIKFFFGKFGVGLLQCLAYASASGEKIDGMTFKKSADLLTAYTLLKEEYTANGKDNPFDGSSNAKKCSQLSRIAEEFLGADHGLQFNKYHYDALQKMIANVNKKGIFTIDNVNGIINSYVIIARHAFNGLKIEINDKAGIFEKAKKNK